MPEIAGHQIIGPGSLSALHKNIIVWIGAHGHAPRGLNPQPLLANGMKRSGDDVFAAFESRTPENLFVLCINTSTDAESNWMDT